MSVSTVRTSKVVLRVSSHGTVLGVLSAQHNYKGYVALTLRSPTQEPTTVSEVHIEDLEEFTKQCKELIGDAGTSA